MSTAFAATPGVARSALYLPQLKGKRVGLVVNQASLNRGMHTIDKLLSLKVGLVKLFALEHGVRGEGGAGEDLGDSIDERTGLPIISLYGPVKKPTPEKLAGLDVIVFDMQDVGVRFFTYISSLGLILEAAAEQKIPVVVFDRPNPNGDYVDGPVLKPALRSFVGAYPIPVVYGLTIGELAKMIHGERWLHTEGLNLRVIPLKGYERNKINTIEGIPSPSLRGAHSIRAYPSLVLFEPTVMSVGRGDDHAFAEYGVPFQKLGEFSFTPVARPWIKHPPYEGEICYGEEFFSRPLQEVPRFTTDIFVSALKRLERPLLTDRHFLELLVGDSRVVDEMLAGEAYSKIRKGFAQELDSYLQLRKKYLLY